MCEHLAGEAVYDFAKFQTPRSRWLIWEVAPEKSML